MRDLLQTASKGVTVNRGRSLLTMLGIIIGVGAVVLMTSVGRSMEGVILGQISVLGPDTVAVFPGNQGPEGGNSALRPDFDSLTFADADTLAQLDTVTDVAPVVFVSGNARYGTEESDPRIVGSLPGYYENQTVEAALGRLHDESDERTARSVVVIGSDIAEDLFLNQSPLDKRIEIANKKYTVIGVLKPVGTQFFQNADERIIIPFSTAIAVTHRTYADMIVLKAQGDLDLVLADVTSLLRQRHGIIPPMDGGTENDDFLIRSAAQAQEILGTVSLGLTLFITMIAGISLIVGGIGIMNIMLVSVTERTREIGLRKAVGARRRDILLQFLIESVFLTFIGGVIGVGIGLGLDYVLATAVGKYLDNYTFEVSIGAIVLALAMAAATGIAFGIYPARKAADLNPIEALQYE